MKNAPTQEPEESIEDINVKLRPVFGLAPNRYIPALFGLAVAILLYFLILHDGLFNPGSKLVIQSQPAGSEVFWGAQRLGATPLEVFVAKGTGELRVVKPGFLPSTQPLAVDSGLLVAHWWPKTVELKVGLKPDPATSLAKVYQPWIDRWSMAMPFGQDYQPPLLFTNFVQDATAAGYSVKDIQNYLFSNLPKVVDPWLYKDFAKAFGVDFAAAFDQQLAAWERIKTDLGRPTPQLAFWLADNLERDKRSELLKTDQFQSLVKAWQEKLALPAVAKVASKDLVVQGLTFKAIPSGAFYFGAEGKTIDIPLEAPYRLPTPVAVGPFWLGETEVTRAQFATFVKDNSQWSPANRDALVRSGLADVNYLADWPNGLPADKDLALPVVNVSWFAAKAYTDWLSQKIAANGLKADLPSEVQWEWAARGASADTVFTSGPNLNRQILSVNQLPADKLGLRGLLGSVWELTNRNFAHGEQLLQVSADSTFDLPVSSQSEVAVRGGCWASPNTVHPAERAAQPAVWATEFLGFRVALVSK